MKRTRNKAESIERIKTATLDLIEQDGYALVTIEAIAARADRNVALIYRYFPRGKADIIMSIAKDLSQAPSSMMPPFHHADSEKLELFVSKMIRVHREHSTILSALEAEYLSKRDVYSPEEFSMITGKTLDAIAPRELFSRFGFQMDDDDGMFSRFLFHVMDSIIHRHVIIVNISETDEELAQRITKLIASCINEHSSK